MKRRFLLGSFALCATLGCAELQHSATVSVSDYGAYRQYRVAPTVERKLAASFEYLRRRPRGTYRSEIERWFFASARHYVKHSWDNPARLEAFLRAVPEGSEAARAAERLVELSLTEKYRVLREQAFDEKVARIERDLASAEAGRHELIASVGTWARRLASIRQWGKRRSELDPELIYAYRLVEPAARCDSEACTRTVVVDYGVPEAKVQVAREAVYDVRMRMEKGGVQAAWITGPDLFTRLGEAVGTSAISSGDIVGRAEAIGQAAEIVAAAVEPVLPAARCAAGAVSPVVLHRVCDGVDLRVVAATELGEEDRILVSPLGSNPQQQNK